MTSATNKFLGKWATCTRCKIGAWAHRHVIGEGMIPAPMLFVGEGPGVSEDALGIPFVGLSGKLLKYALAEAGVGPELVYYTNLVACRPCDSPSKTNRPPSKTEVANCSERLEKIVFLVRPQIIVAVGSCPSKYLGASYRTYPVRTISHPSYILRNGGKGGALYKPWLSSIKFILNLLD